MCWRSARPSQIRALRGNERCVKAAEGLRLALEDRPYHFCDACFTGNYPIDISNSVRSRQMRLFEERKK